MTRTKLFLNLVTISLVIGNAYTAQCEDHSGFVKNVVNKVFGNTLSKTLLHGNTISKNQRIRTSRDSSTEIEFLEKSNLYIGELSDLRLQGLSNQKDSDAISRRILMKKGVMRYASRQSSNENINISTPHADLHLDRGIVDVFADSAGTEILVHEGVVDVRIPSRSERLYAGQTYRISTKGATDFIRFNSERMRVSVKNMLRLIEVSEGQLPRSASKIEKPKDNINRSLEYLPQMKNAVTGKNMKNILYMDLSYGRVIIEMMPRVAPNHVKRIIRLVRQKFYDGLRFHNVVEGFVAETGDPTGTGLGGSGTSIKAELSKMPFIRGLVGMKHDRNNLNNADSQFFILLGDAKHLEGKYTAWGRVIYGMLLLDRMRKGSPPENPDYIVKMRVAVDTQD